MKENIKTAAAAAGIIAFFFFASNVDAIVDYVFSLF